MRKKSVSMGEEEEEKEEKEEGCDSHFLEYCFFSYL